MKRAKPTSFFFLLASIGALTLSSCNLIFFRNTGAEIEIDPHNGFMQPGSTHQFQAVRLNSDGTYESVSRSASWATSNRDVVLVSGTGLVEAVSPGIGAIGASLSGESGVAMITVIDPEPSPTATPEASPSGTPEATPVSWVPNHGFEDPGYMDYQEQIPGGGVVSDYVPGWKLDAGEQDGLYNIGINTFADPEAGSNYLYLGQENVANPNVVTMSASADTAITVNSATRFYIRFKVLEFEGESNHSKFEYPIRIIITVNNRDCYLFLRSTNAGNGGENANKDVWKEAELGLEYLLLTTVEDKVAYQILPGDIISRIIIEPKGIYWKILIDDIDIIS